MKKESKVKNPIKITTLKIIRNFKNLSNLICFCIMLIIITLINTLNVASPHPVKVTSPLKTTQVLLQQSKYFLKKNKSKIM